MPEIDDWDDVRFFLAVARAGGFTAAARRLGVNQSTVSRRIAELEAAVDGELFHRSTREFTPSELAVRLLEHAEHIERAMAAFDRAAKETDEPVGVVRVATAEELASALLVPSFATLRASYPQVQLQIVGEGRVSRLDRGEADVALRLVRPSQGALVCRRVATLEYAAYASRGYLRRCRNQTLERMDWLSLDDPHGVLPEARWVTDVLRSRAPVLATNNTLDIAAAAARGIGAALLPQLLAAQYDNLVRIEPKTAPVLTRSLWLVTHRSLAPIARVRAVMEWIADACASAMA
ncbi:MAG: LysR family transcriptional regulator [Myxococcota bacterium]